MNKSLGFDLQMAQEQQRIKASSSLVVEHKMSPVSNEEVNEVYSSQLVDGLTDEMGYFLREVTKNFQMFQL